MPRVVIAPDKFRGTATATQVAAAIAQVAIERGWEAIELPLADGGEGTLDALGGPNRCDRVTGPLGKPVSASWRLVAGVAVIEAAQACGLARAGGADYNDPLAATSRGVGELIRCAQSAGAKEIVVGIGGVASTDGGLPALQALGLRSFAQSGLQVKVCCDVETTFVDAARMFGPQKGATSADEVAALVERLQALSDYYQRRFEADVASMPGSGAGGGLAGGLAAAGAHLCSGFDTIADALRLDEYLAHADLVVTGEGRLDRTSLNGKVVGGVVSRARAARVPAVGIVGDCELADVDGLDVVSLTTMFGRECALADTLPSVSAAAATVFDAYSNLA